MKVESLGVGSVGPRSGWRKWRGMGRCGVGVEKPVFGWRAYMKVSGEDAGWKKEGKMKH
jgi:hypothetical protein